ncbi:MAG: hypothetical protein R3C18_02500 [Planctomycetaceae bacterium]
MLTTQRTFVAALLSLAMMVMTTQFAAAQSPTNAALQARAKMQQRHQQTGSIGGGYRPYSAWTYQNSAQSHAQALNSYGQNCQQLPAATAREHLTAIQQNVAATRKEIAKLGEEASKEAEVREQVVALEKHLAECEKLCGMMEKTITDDGVETVQMCAHCTGLEAKLKAAGVEHQALLKKLGIEPPIPASPHGDHDHKSDAEPVKKP